MRLREVLKALVAREGLRNANLELADRKNLASLLERIAQYVGDDFPGGTDWDPAEHAELCAWLVARMRDDFDAFRSGYKRLLAKGIEPAFCKAVYKRWPPDPDVFGPLE